MEKIGWYLFIILTLWVAPPVIIQPMGEFACHFGVGMVTVVDAVITPSVMDPRGIGLLTSFME